MNGFYPTDSSLLKIYAMGEDHALGDEAKRYWACWTPAQRAAYDRGYKHVRDSFSITALTAFIQEEQQAAMGTTP